MKPETLIYDRIKKIIADYCGKIVLFAAISQTSYEIFFYVDIDSRMIQCFELAEQGLLDENKLDDVFSDIAKIIRESKEYQNDKCNIVTIILDKSGLRKYMEYYEKDVRMYKIKKAWKEKYLS